MTQRERLLTALRGEIPDRVPVTWELVGRYAHALTGRETWEAMCDAHRMIGSAIFNLQGVGPVVHTRHGPGFENRSETSTGPDGSHITTQTIRTPSGTITQKSIADFVPGDPLLGKRVEYFVKTHSDYEVLADFVQEGVRTASLDNSASLEARQYVGDDGLAGFWMSDSLYQLANSRPPADFVLDLVDEPGLIEEILSVIDRQKELEIQAFNESAAEVLVYDICWASTDLLNPQLVERFVIPRAREAVNNVSGDKIVGFFTSGRIRAVVPRLVELGPAFIQHFDVLGDCDLAEVKQAFGERTCIIGNYSPVILSRGTIQQAREEARRCLDAAMEGGGYIMSSSDEVPADARLDNMKAVVELVAQEGQYQ